MKLRLQTLIRNMKGVPPNMVLVRGGEFLKGTAEKTIGNPTGKVTIDPFYMSKFEVTNFQYKRFVDAGGYEKKEYWSETGWKRIKEFVSVDTFPGPAFWLKGSYPKGDDDLPVIFG